MKEFIKQPQTFPPPPNEDTPDDPAYLEELYRRLPEQTRRAKQTRPGACGSPEWYGKIGQWWRQARRERRLTIRQAVDERGISLNEIRLLEAGFATESELKDGTLARYAEWGLGDRALYHQFRREFFANDVASDVLEHVPG